MNNPMFGNPGTSKSASRPRGTGTGTVGYGLKLPVNKAISSSAFINNTMAGAFNNSFPMEYPNGAHSIPVSVGNFFLSHGRPMVTPVICSVKDAVSTSPVTYSNEYSSELTAEYTTSYVPDNDSGNADVGPQFPTDFATIMKHYELLGGIEELNAKIQKGCTSINNEEINENGNRSTSKAEESGHKIDDINSYLQHMKAAHFLKTMGKFPVINIPQDVPYVEPKYKNAEQQTEVLQQRNVSQQTFSIGCNSEPDEFFNHVDLKRRKIHDYKSFINKRKAAVESMRLSSGKVDLNGVAGLSDVKIVIRETFLLPLTHPHLFQLFQGAIKRCCRCLLYGPPGTGKTLLAQAIASELGAYLYYVSCAGILSCYIGESEKNVKELFEHALEEEDTSIIFFDEIDSVCRKRTEGESEHSRRLKTELLKYFENPAMEESQVYILSATNCPWDLDPAFLRRFQRHIYVPLPDKDARQQIISQQLGQLRILLSEDDWSQILSQTEGFSGSDLTNFVSIALAQPNRELLRATHWRYFDGEHVVPCDSNLPTAFNAALDDIPPEKIMARSVVLSDFLYAAHETPRTVTDDHILQFENFKKQFSR